MDLISELESELLGTSEAASPTSVRLRTSSGEFELRMPQLGDDYVAGLTFGVLVVVPMTSVLEIRGSQLPHRVELNIFEFLAKQRTPVRLRLNSEAGGDCWLLNIDQMWLRIAIAQGVSWVPLSTVRSLEILPVDNSTH
jgi:hypothetical protein